MSGNVQTPPIATMQVSAGQASIFPVTFGGYPLEGSRCVSAQYSWTAQTGYVEDLSGLVARGVETTIQSVYVDNSANTQPVSILVYGTEHLVVCPAQAQGFFPLFFTGQPQFQITVPATVANGVTRLFLLNVPGNAAGVWGAPNAANSINALYTPGPTESVAGGSRLVGVDAYGSLLVDTEAQGPVYSAAFDIVPAAANPTDIVQIVGSASATVRIHQLGVSFSASAAVPTMQLAWLKRSTANSGGTSTTPGIVAHDGNNAAPGAVINAYTANPASLGTLIGNIEQFYMASSLQASTQPTIFNYGTSDQSVVLRGTGSCLSLSGLGVTLPSGLTLAVKIKWSEI